MSRDNRSPPQKRRRYMPEEERESPSEMEDMLDSVGVSGGDSPSTCCPTFPCSSSSCSTCCSEVCNPSEEDISAGGTPSAFHSSVMSGPSCPLVLTPGSQSDPPLSQQREADAGSSQAPPFAFPLLGSEIEVKTSDLVRYLLHKYAMKDLATKAEMLTTVIGQYEVYYQMILIKASECLLLTFGIEVKPMDPSGHSYMLVPALGITYDGCECDVQGLPKTGLLIRILCIAFINGGHASEELLWGMLGNIGVYARQRHFLCNDPETLVTDEFVWEGYLEIRRVPIGDFPQYQVLWGPRAHAEVRKMKILEFWSNLTGSDPISFPMLYAEALIDDIEKDEIESAQARAAGAGDSAAMRSASSAQEAAPAASREDRFQQGFQ